MSLFKGSGVAIITPFNDNVIDFKRLGELLEWHIASGTDAIVICGTTGEASTLSDEEKKATIKFTVEQVNKRIPVIAGTGSNDTKHTIELSLWAEGVGVDGLLIITPYYNKTSQRGMYEHFKAIAQNVSLPIIIYNVPSRTGLNILPETLKDLTEVKNIAAIKEASGNISQIAKIKLLCDDKLLIYSGNDDQTLPIMSLGAIGVISVLANILPKEVHELCTAYLSGDTAKALKIQLSTLALTNALFLEPNPIPVKTAMNLMGMKVGGLRLPLYEMGDKTEILEKELKAYGLI